MCLNAQTFIFLLVHCFQAVFIPALQISSEDIFEAFECKLSVCRMTANESTASSCFNKFINEWNTHSANIYIHIPMQVHTIAFSVRICMSNFNRKNSLFWKIINCWNERLWTKTFHSQIERPSVLTTYSAAIICASQISDWTMDLQQGILK